MKTVANLHGFKAPYDALPLADGSVLVAEIATGSVVKASGAGSRHAPDRGQRPGRAGGRWCWAATARCT
jgi:hypothetical protein